jgi:hypothetical protein
MLNALMPARYQPPNPGRDERPRTVEAPQVFTLAPDHAGIETFNDTFSRVGRMRHNQARDGPVETTKDHALWWTDAIGQADPSHLRLCRT